MNAAGYEIIPVRMCTGKRPEDLIWGCVKFRPIFTSPKFYVMAYRNKIIRNPLSGQEIRFLQTASDTGGALLEMESSYSPGSVEPPSHIHPVQTEHFRIESGEMSVRINGSVQILRAGDTLEVPPNTPHAMWNHGHQQATINWQVRPALNMEHFFETFMGLATDGKTKPNGMPDMLQISMLMRRFSGVIRMVKPSYPVQRIVFGILSPVAWMLGYRSVYTRYED